MTPYLPLLFGTLNIILGGYLFLTSFGLYQPKKSTDTGKPWISKDILKILSIIIILNGLYDFVSDGNRYLLYDEIEWTLEYRNKMVSTCIDLSESAEEHPEFARKFCECSVDEVISNYSYREYAKISKLPPDEVAKEMQYIVDECRKKVTVSD